MSRGSVFVKRLEVLNRRIDYLKSKIADSDRDLSYPKAELGALLWVIDIIENYPDEALSVIPNGGASKSDKDSIEHL